MSNQSVFRGEKLASLKLVSQPKLLESRFLETASSPIDQAIGSFSVNDQLSRTQFTASQMGFLVPMLDYFVRFVTATTIDFLESAET